MKIARKLWTLFDRFNEVMSYAASALLVTVAVAVSLDVLIRYTLGHTFAGLFELTEFSLLWFTFLGTAYVLKIGGHVNMDLLFTRMSPTHQALASALMSFANALLFAVIGWYGVSVTLQDYRSGALMPSVLLPPKWIIEVIIPIGCFLLTLQLVRMTYEYWVKWKELSRKGGAS